MSGDQPDLFGDEPAPAPVGRRDNIVIGTCSWTDPSLIKSKGFYPKGCSSAEARLRYYASQFPIVEVDSSFFAMPNAVNSTLWAERTPANFVFNVKAFRLLTGHQTPAASFPGDLAVLLPPLKGRAKNYYYRDTPEEVRDELWRRFIEALRPLKDAGKLLAVHFQFAPWATNSPDWRAHVEDCVARMAGHRVAVEFRNRSWFGAGHAEQTLRWQGDLGVCHVVVDEPQVGNFAHSLWAVTQPSLVVVRLHGRNADTWEAKGLSASSERFNYEYNDSELQDLAARIGQLADDAFQVAVLLNVNFEDQGIKAARRLTLLLRRVGLPAP